MDKANRTTRMFIPKHLYSTQVTELNTKNTVPHIII